jgi:hypothetical protein
MEIRINEFISNVKMYEIKGIVNEAEQIFREKQEHQARVMAETTIRDGVSKLEPY